MTQRQIPAVYMRGGTSKGVFFLRDSLPADPRLRDRILLRVIGSPDAHGKHTDGMGGGTSSTSKVVLVSRSTREDCDVDYLFGQVSIEKPAIDWSGNCGNLTSAVGPFAIAQGLVKVPADGIATVRIWQANVKAKIDAHVPMANGEVVEGGYFNLDGVAFPAAEIRLDFLDPGAADGEEGWQGSIFPAGSVRSNLNVPGLGDLDVTMICAGNPTIFIDASQLGLCGNEMQSDVNTDSALLDRCETIRAHAAVRMGLANGPEEATSIRPHTPKLAFVAKPAAFVASDGRSVGMTDMDLNARIISMGKLHHAMTGTGAIAIAVAAAIPGTVVNSLLDRTQRDEQSCVVETEVRFGHPSGVTTVRAEAKQREGEWVVTKASMSRSARRLMEGWVLVPDPL
jgi:probable AcnD-accessory protein PrpF